MAQQYIVDGCIRVHYFARVSNERREAGGATRGFRDLGYVVRQVHNVRCGSRSSIDKPIW